MGVFGGRGVFAWLAAGAFGWRRCLGGLGEGWVEWPFAGDFVVWKIRGWIFFFGCSGFTSSFPVVVVADVLATIVVPDLVVAKA